MKRISVILTALCLIFIVTACNQTDTPQEPAPEVVVVAVTETFTPVPTFTPTVPPPTATPTKGPPTPTATLVLTATPTPIPTATPQLHIVEEFDTLLGIAVDYDVDYETLLAVNGVTDEESFLQLGQAIIIPTAPNNAVQAEADTDGQSPAEAIDESIQPGGNNKANSAAEPVDTTQAVVAEAEPAPAPPSAPIISGPPPPDISHGANINPLSGLPVADPATLNRRPLLVRIGNDTAARQSQVGLNRAEVVYEEITEWWVTRFTAIFLGESPNTVSPVRSARLINVQLVPQYQGALAHSGGSDGVRWEISQAPITNLDEFYNMAPYFYRPNEGWQTRLALDAESARNYMVANGLEAAVRQNGFLFSDSPPSSQPGEDIFVPYPSRTSFTEWHYDAGSGKYLRWINGEALVDAEDGQQIAAANVIIYFAEHQQTDIVEDSKGATAIRIIVSGSGLAWMFRDGLLTTGTWQSDGVSTPFFRNESGDPYALKPGNTWIQVVPTYYTIGLNSADEASSR